VSFVTDTTTWTKQDSAGEGMAVATMSETEAVRAAQAGDRTAFGHLYESYLSRIYDYALGMLRNRADAEDVTSETFLRAVENLGSLRDPAAFKGWLYAIARNAALRVTDRRRKVVAVDEHDDGAVSVDPTPLPVPDDHAEQAELHDLMDAAAAVLSERDRTVYELSVRHGLSSAEIADVLGVRPPYAYILVNRLKTSVGESLEAVLLARAGTAACEELARIAAMDIRLTTRVRKAITRHARTCAACAETKRRRASVPALMQGTAFAQPGAGFASGLAASIEAVWGRAAATAATTGLATVLWSLLVVLVLAAGVFAAGAQRTIVRSEPHHTANVVPVSVKAAAFKAPRPSAAPRLVPVVLHQVPPEPQLQAPPTQPNDAQVVVVDNSGASSGDSSSGSSESSSSSGSSSSGPSSKGDGRPSPKDSNPLP
jgi:RNA polymerase sigma factor (sigma-70 family)